MRNIQIIIRRIEFEYAPTLASYHDVVGATVYVLVKKRDGRSISMEFPLLDYATLYAQIESLAESEWDKWLEAAKSGRQTESAHPPTPFVG